MRKLYYTTILCLPLTVSAEVGIFNGSADELAVTSGSEQIVSLAPGGHFSWEPSDGFTNSTLLFTEYNATNGVSDLSVSYMVSDGDLVSFDSAGHSWQSAQFLQNAPATDSQMASYFTAGLESGSALAAILLGFIAVRRALQMGEQWD